MLPKITESTVCYQIPPLFRFLPSRDVSTTSVILPEVQVIPLINQKSRKAKFISESIRSQESCNQHFLQVLPPSASQIPHKPSLVLLKHSIPQEGSRFPPSSPQPTCCQRGTSLDATLCSAPCPRGQNRLTRHGGVFNVPGSVPSRCSEHVVHDEQRGSVGKHKTLLRNLDARGMVYGASHQDGLGRWWALTKPRQSSSEGGYRDTFRSQVFPQVHQVQIRKAEDKDNQKFSPSLTHLKQTKDLFNLI